ncbi:Glutathione S-transferase [Cupriavidus necator]|uniref:Glutathione S-transferase family protein n=1 Tax=Cupriavidus necator (strain ATCC 17699 / DSM 428 / KCTC 22496 / NCIMB 10442 / H16 / Stanier 337) TaxID=381666 RepID=Q0KC15_CUPNH|nr:MULTISPECIES: glutathione S-transferase C-terminal domain-containing protein [Cupriavidus]EON17733.1 glutathione S-transferase-like protein [Cupriavidus sp. GA3-3]KUE89813.1 glutathione S-transferase [Cupriavidus necator]QCC00345.1 glutathione S-transferase family protein [Cupriavidus necator H16]QQB76837.1 glutathione S-transferase family protein [Cupriavidus necator]WKA42204.1 glutathione S-transferase C-terminal domain-containing protein [Cupriavidus necator]
MITLYTFGPAFGLPDASPFVTKAEMLLKLAGLPYQARRGSLRRAPKGKLPYLDDMGRIVADSTLIRWHIEKTYHIDFDAGLSAAERGIAWAAEKLMEDHLYWAVARVRWLDQANFDKGPAQFFRGVPAPVRGLAERLVRYKVRKTLWGQGLGRHSEEDLVALASKGVTSIADILGDKPYLMGNVPCGADATLFAFAGSLLCPVFDTPIRTAAEGHANLVAYMERMRAEFYPELALESAAA